MQYEQNLVRNYSDNNSVMYQYISNLTKLRSLPLTIYLTTEVVSSDYDKACLFNKLFHSVFTQESALNFAPQLSLSDTPCTINFSEQEVNDSGDTKMA